MLTVKQKVLYQKSKQKIQKAFPNAKIQQNHHKHYYIVDQYGYRLLKDEFDIGNQKTIYLAWVKTAEMLWFKHIVDVNNARFSDDKIFKSILKSEDKILKNSEDE